MKNNKLICIKVFRDEELHIHPHGVHVFLYVYTHFMPQSTFVLYVADGERES